MSQAKLLYRSINKQISLMAAIAMLGLVTFLSAFFIVSDTASNSYATSVESEIKAEVDGTYYVMLSASDINFSVTPSSTAQLSKQNINVNVETNATGGADLYLAMSGNTNALHLNGDTTSTAPAIEATSSPVAANDLAANTWGYSTDDQTYSAVPTANSDPALLASVDGESVGSSAGGVITASVPVYFAASVDTSIPAGSYANRMTYSAVTDGGIITEATLTKIEIDGAEVENMQPEVENTLLITTNLMTNTYGTPRVYYETTSPAGYQECGDVVVGRNESGYMTITCKVTPSQAATGVTLHIVPKGSSDDIFCTNGDYQADTSECEAGEWKWGSFAISMNDIPHIMSELPTMQAMTPEFCASVTMDSPGNTARVQDSRDGKYYWLAKLADGNCWMTQNLDLDLDSRTLTSTDSDVSSSWAFNGSWYTVANQGSTSSTAIQGWDLGEYVKTNPIDTTECTSYSNLGECADQFTSAVGLMPMIEAVNEGKAPEENVSIQGDQYDAHYLVGNYYSWTAATAGTGNSISGGEASGSICPAGWKLPLSNAVNNNVSGSFYYLLNQYGLTSVPESGSNNAATSPLYFVRGGDVTSGSFLYRAGRSVYLWSRSTGSSTNAYSLNFGPNLVYPSGHYDRYLGLSVRCVAAQ